MCSGLFAIKDYRDAVNQDDFNKAVRKVAESKKLEGKLEYQKLWVIYCVGAMAFESKQFEAWPCTIPPEMTDIAPTVLRFDQHEIVGLIAMRNKMRKKFAAARCVCCTASFLSHLPISPSGGDNRTLWREPLFRTSWLVPKLPSHEILGMESWYCTHFTRLRLKKCAWRSAPPLLNIDVAVVSLWLKLVNRLSINYRPLFPMFSTKIEDQYDGTNRWILLENSKNYNSNVRRQVGGEIVWLSASSAIPCWCLLLYCLRPFVNRLS